MFSVIKCLNSNFNWNFPPHHDWDFDRYWNSNLMKTMNWDIELGYKILLGKWENSIFSFWNNWIELLVLFPCAHWIVWHWKLIANWNGLCKPCYVNVQLNWFFFFSLCFNYKIKSYELRWIRKPVFELDDKIHCCAKWKSRTWIEKSIL